MFKHILIATGASESGLQATVTGLKLARGLGARTTAVNVVRPNPCAGTSSTPYCSLESSKCDPAASPLSAAARLSRCWGVECALLQISDDVGSGILRVANSEECDLIVLGSIGERSYKLLLMGGDAAGVLALSSVPVLVCR
jgi:nucleotide-binding universal stress UspA family protein